MTHPTREEWMSYLYDETGPETKPALRTHLDGCAECRTQLDAWTRASRRLDDWQLPQRRKRRAIPLVKLAAAAAVVALAVAGAARITTLNNEVKNLRAELRRESAERVALTEQATKAATAEAQSLIADFAKAFEEKRAEEQRVTLAALQQISTKYAQDFSGLRKELETVAVLTEAGLRQAHSEIANITYTPETK
jgi:hypothetical protein